MRVVHFLNSVQLARGGVVRAVLDMAAAQAEAGASVAVLTGDASDAPADWDGGAGRPAIVTTDGGDAAGVFEGAGVFHGHGLWAPGMATWAIAAKRAGVPTVISGHGMLSAWALRSSRLKKTVYLALRLGRVLRDADAVHFACEGERTEALKRFSFGRAEVIPLIVHDGPYRELPGIGQAESIAPGFGGEIPTLLFLSRVVGGKGVERLIDACALLRSRGVGHRLLIAGPGEPGYLDQISSQIERQGLGDDVRLVGMVGGEAKTSLLKAADLTVLPSDHENFSVSLFESIASGTPVLASPEVQTKQELIDSGAGEIAERTPEAIADRIAAMLADREALRARGASGRAWFMRELASDRIAERYLAFYRSLGG